MFWTDVYLKKASFSQFNLTSCSWCLVPVWRLHHCVVIFFWSSGMIDCMFTFENRVPITRLGASEVWHLSLPPDEQLQ